MLDAASNLNNAFMLSRREVITHKPIEDEHRLVAPGKFGYRNILIQREQVYNWLLNIWRSFVH